MQLPSALLLAVFMGVGQSASVDQIDIPALYDGGVLPVESCARHCLPSLTVAVKDLFDLTDMVKGYEGICRTYKSVRSCVKNSCDSDDYASFNSYADTVFSACKVNTDHFKPYVSCLEKKLDIAMKKCDSKCRLTDAAAELSHSIPLKAASFFGGSAVVLVMKMGPLCSSVSCFSSCSSSEVNRLCPGAGKPVADLMLNPVLPNKTAEKEEEESAFKTIAKVLLPTGCVPFLDNKQVAKMERGTFVEPKEGEMIDEEPVDNTNDYYHQTEDEDDKGKTRGRRSFSSY